MLPTLPVQVLTVIADIVVFIFVAYYLPRIRAHEKIVEKKESKIDTDYHQVVDNALSRERKILDDATQEAEQIIKDAKYISSESQNAVNQSLQTITAEVQKEATNTAQVFMNNYTTALNAISAQTLNELQKVTQGLGQDLQKQVKDFHDRMLPNLEKELEEYKKTRLKETDQLIVRLIQKVSEELMNKSIPIADHETLVTDSLEKAKKEGVFS